MKKKTLLLAIILFTILSCDKDNDKLPVNPIDQLPTATQTGANIFACLLDGEVFIPGNVSIPLESQYQLINGKYSFAIDAARRFNSNRYIALGMGTNELEIIEGKTYDLLENEIGKANGGFFLNVSATFTSSVNSGKMKITKLDLINHIISGTFWYDIIDNQGVKHEIREGRFDVHFTT
jgi:hypothetical protein